LYNGNTALTQSGLTGYNNQWGACCARDINTNFTTTAPYLALNLAFGQFDIDAGVRREKFKASGSYYGSTSAPVSVDVNGDGTLSLAEKNVYVSDRSNPGKVDYSINYTNKTIGVNYRINNDMSTFARYSEGNRAISDRFYFSPNVDWKTGALTTAGAYAALAPVKQTEIGFRFRTKGAVNFNLDATYFRATTEEFDFDQTRQDDPTKPNYQGPKLNTVGYKSDGIELTSSLAASGFRLDANITYAKGVKTKDFGNAATIGKEEPGNPKLRYILSPSYSIGPARFGMNFRGQGSQYGDGLNKQVLSGYMIMGAFVNYDITQNLTANLNINNLADKVACGGGGGFVGGSTTVYGCGVEIGRTFSAGIRYKF
ncbi:MAG: hypothetical protein RLZZ502_1, partial [Pseudomonadota bacterium]